MQSVNASKSSAPAPGSGPTRARGRGIAEDLEQLRLALRERKGVELALDASAPPAPNLSGFFQSLKEEFDAIGWNKAPELVERHIADPHQCAAVLTELGKLCRDQNSFVAFELGQKAHALDPQPYRAKWLSFVAFEAGHITEAARLLESVPRHTRFRGSEARVAAQIEGCRRMLASEPAIPRPWSRAYEAVPRSLLYVTASCQPLHLSGYTVRTQALLKAVAATDWKVTCVARPGYPWDSIGPTVTAAPSARSAGVDYHFIRGAHISAMPPDAYITAAATLIESKAREIRPAIIQAASNHFTALPALIAARRLGVPFVYEVRGLGEIAASVGKDGWERSERFQLASRLEALAASSADAVFTLSRQLSHELQNRGVAARRIHLLPNGADAGLVDVIERDRGLLAGLGLDPDVFTIGFAGGIKYYEGLDDLLEAVAHLHKEGKRAQAVIVGDGTHLPALREKVSALQLGHAVRFVGPQPQPLAQAYLRAADAAAVPRKRLAVGETVLPLKPFEAMALGIPLIMSDVAPLADIARDGGAAVLFEASNATSLATRIASLMGDSRQRSELAARGREYIATRNSWAHVGQKMVAVLDEVDRKARLPSPFFSRFKRASRFIQRVIRGEETESERQRTAADVALLSTSDLFDASWYLQRYPDVVRTRMNPFEHYLRHGAGEARDPGPGFSTRAYVARHPDIARMGVNPLVHYLRYGMKKTELQQNGASSSSPRTS